MHAVRKGVDTHFYRAIRLYGEADFSMAPLVENIPTEAEANRLEKLWIASLQTHLPEVGYNSTMGGDGCKPNAETLEKLREVGRRHKHHTPEAKKKIGDAMRGRKLSAETRAKISAAHTGMKYGPEFGQKQSALRQGKKTKPCSEDKKKKISATNTGLKRSEETKQHLREAWLKRKQRIGNDQQESNRSRERLDDRSEETSLLHNLTLYSCGAC